MRMTRNHVPSGAQVRILSLSFFASFLVNSTLKLGALRNAISFQSVLKMRWERRRKYARFAKVVRCGKILGATLIFSGPVLQTPEGPNHRDMPDIPTHVTTDIRLSYRKTHRKDTDRA